MAFYNFRIALNLLQHIALTYSINEKAQNFLMLLIPTFLNSSTHLTMKINILHPPRHSINEETLQSLQTTRGHG